MAKAGFLIATITSGTSLSAALDLTLLGGVPASIQMPAAWDAANLTFQVSADGTTFQNYFDSAGAGAEIVVGAAASRVIRLVPTDFWGIRFLKIRSGTSGLAVNQTADRALFLVYREDGA